MNKETQDSSLPGKSGKNKNGQLIGRKGKDTRQRILEATAQAIETTPLRDIRVVEIARKANTSKASFYVYFESVSDVVLALIAALPVSEPSRYKLDFDDWEGTRAEELAARFIQTYSDAWHQHAALMRVRNLAAEEGDMRFILARRNAVRPIIDAMRVRLDWLREAGHLPAHLHGYSAAGMLLTVLERFMVVVKIASGEYGQTYDHMLAAAAHIYASMLAVPGDKVPAGGG